MNDEVRTTAAGAGKWGLLAILWVAFFLHQGTRQVYNALLPQIQLGLGISDSARMGLVGTVFTLVYGLSVPFAGILGDFLGRKTLIAGGLLVFSCGIFVSGFATGIGLLILAYGILNGGGQAFFYPSTCSIISEAHGEKTRATALAILQTALYGGIIICSWASGKMAAAHEAGGSGWKLPFWIFGGLGIAWVVALLFLLPGGRARKVAAGEKAPRLAEALTIFFRRPTALLMAVAFGFVIYVDCGFKTWMPTFLQGKGMDPALAAFNAVVWHYAGAIIGVLAASRITDRIAQRRPAVRFEAAILGPVVAAPFIVLMAYSPSNAVCFGAMFAYGIFRGVWDSNQFAAVFEVIPSRYHATATGLMLAFAFAFGSTAPTVLGFMRDGAGMTAGIASLAAFYLAGGLTVAVARIFFAGKDMVEK